MLVRVITALLLAPLVILLTLYLPTHWLSVAFLAVVLVGLYEWNQLTIKSSILFSITAIGLAVATWGLIAQPKVLLAICALATLFWVYQIHSLRRSNRQSEQQPAPAPIFVAANFVLGAFCLLGVWAALVLIHQQPEQGPIATIALLFIVWAADSFAYFIGRAFGRHPLAAALSPNKTLEGVVGGLCGAFLLAVWFGDMLDLPLKILAAWVVAGVGAAAFSVVGDLYESRLKRLAKVKDSGQLLPGHGGILDRIDGLIAAAPVFVILIFVVSVFAGFGPWLP